MLSFKKIRLNSFTSTDLRDSLLLKKSPAKRKASLWQACNSTQTKSLALPAVKFVLHITLQKLFLTLKEKSMVRSPNKMRMKFKMTLRTDTRTHQNLNGRKRRIRKTSILKIRMKVIFTIWIIIEKDMLRNQIKFNPVSFNLRRWVLKMNQMRIDTLKNFQRIWSSKCRHSLCQRLGKLIDPILQKFKQKPIWLTQIG